MWLLWFCGLGLCCLSGWMSGLVVFGVGWCFTWNVGLMGAQCGVVSRGTSLLSIFMAGYDNGWWVGWVVCCGDSFLSVWLFSVWISYICSPTERTGILEITISFMATYRCFT